MTDEQRIEYADRLVKLFEQSPNPKDRHRIVIVDEISRVHLGQTQPLVTLKTAYRCLACRALTVYLQCAHPGCSYRKYLPWQPCGLRFFCDDCAADQKNRQVKLWLRLIIEVLKSHGLNHVGGTKLEWVLPDALDTKNIARFGDYIRHTFAPDGQWLLATAVDPLLGIIRGLYLETDHVGNSYHRLVTVDSYNSNKPGKTHPGGRPPLWVPERLPLSISPHSQLPGFQASLSLGLEWTVNAPTERSYVEPSEIEPARAMWIHKAYRGHRLYSAHGLLHGVRSRRLEYQGMNSRANRDFAGYGAPVFPQYCPEHRIRLMQALDFHFPSHCEYRRDCSTQGLM